MKNLTLVNGTGWNVLATVGHHEYWLHTNGWINVFNTKTGEMMEV